MSIDEGTAIAKKLADSYYSIHPTNNFFKLPAPMVVYIFE